MIKVEAIKEFTLGRYEEIKDSIVRKGYEQEGKLFVGDTFICSEELADYLTGGNPNKIVAVKVIEVLPKEKTTKKKTSKK